jgi:predicted short-subunit dehydrogenase-like oxidoreductase (DUF2520 family)
VPYLRKPLQVALVCAGAISRTSLSRLPVLTDRLGPVLSSSIRIASRAVNVLGAGWPVSHYEELSSARTIIISVPDDMLDFTVQQLKQVKFSWKRRGVVLANSLRDSTALEPLHTAGAAVGSFNAIEALDKRHFVIEGEPVAVSAMRGLLDFPAARSIEIDRGVKQIYFAGVNLATSAIVPALAAASESFRLAGIQTKEADTLVKAFAHRAVDAFRRAQRRS